jgi:type IV secretion system protein VirB10
MRLLCILFLAAATLVAQTPAEPEAPQAPAAAQTPATPATPAKAEAPAAAQAPADPAAPAKAETPAPAAEPEGAETAPEPTPGTITVPAGTKVPLILKHAVSTKNARVGDNVYLETTFPVAQDDQIVIPAGTYVQGVVSAVQRSPRVKGRAELLLHFRTMIFPNGYTVSLPGVLDNIPGADKTTVKPDEGTVEAGGTKGKDVGKVVTGAGTGAVIGGLAGAGKGAAIGGAAGAAAGLLVGLFSRGDEVRLETGTAVEMVLQRPLVLEEPRLRRTGRELVPVDSSNRKLERPVLTPPPQTN